MEDARKGYTSAADRTDHPALFGRFMAMFLEAVRSGRVSPAQGAEIARETSEDSAVEFNNIEERE